MNWEKMFFAYKNIVKEGTEWKPAWPFENLVLPIRPVCIDQYFKINLNIYPSLNLGPLLFVLPVFIIIQGSYFIVWKKYVAG